MSAANKNVIWFEDLSRGDVALVGGKNSSLGEMVQQLGSKGIDVPPGFATTSDAFRAFIKANNLNDVIADAMSMLESGKRTLAETGKAVRAAIVAGDWPDDIRESILSAYRELSERTGNKELSVAVRSSATAEDLPDASFAGQQETYLNVRGEAALLSTCRRCYASLFTDRAITYRKIQGFDHNQVALSIGVQLMVRSDIGGSGVMFSIDTESGFDKVVLINAAWGLGENVVQGAVTPDEYEVFKPIVEKTCGVKEIKMIYAGTEGGETKNVPTSKAERGAYVLTDEEILNLARQAATIEKHYGQAMDMEWAKDGETGKLYIVQARPETVQSRIDVTALKTYTIGKTGKTLITGLSVGAAVRAGRVCMIENVKDIDKFIDGSILVTSTTDPDWVPIMKRAAAIVTDHGGRTSHAAIVSRELGLPAIVGTGNATHILHDQQEVTISCAGGVGLARMEFVVNSAVKVHPMALVHFDTLKDEAAKAEIAELTRRYENKGDYFVETLARGLSRIAAVAYPKPVIVRMSDFKTNEYAELLGGRAFEPKEENPMIGFRGASRYYSDNYREGFALECKAIKMLREEMGFDNVVVMIPFCRSPDEADKVLAVMAENGLARGENGMQVYVMGEIPSNVIRAAEFAERFDGFSIGSNDLTQLTLGVDRDSGELADLFSEADPAVIWMIETLIERAHAAGAKVGLCGQAPSNNPAFAKLLVQAGIDSISVTPDSFVAVKENVAEAEKTGQ